MFLLHFLRWLRQNTDLDFEILIGKGGPLEPEFAKVATVQTQKNLQSPEVIRTFSLIYSNTACNSKLLQSLPTGNIPIVTHVHELDSGFNCIGARAMAAMVAQTNSFIGCSQIVCQRLEHVFKISRDNIHLHYEMIDDAIQNQKLSKENSIARAQYGIPQDALVVAACGTFDFRKAGDIFIQLAAKVKQKLAHSHPVKFIWIGSLGNASFFDFLQLDVRKLGLSTTLQFVGELKDPHSLLAECDIFCLTSREDPFPLAMLEAGALEKPVICFEDSGGGSEFCSLGGGISVPYLDVEAMANTVLELQKSQSLRSAIGGRAAQLVRNSFTVSNCAPILFQRLQSFLEGNIAERPYWNYETKYTQIYETWCLAESPEQQLVKFDLDQHANFKEAKALADQGKKDSYIKLLVNMATKALATNNPTIIYESFSEISKKLMPVDPKIAGPMHKSAQNILKNVLQPQPDWLEVGPTGVSFS